MFNNYFMVEQKSKTSFYLKAMLMLMNIVLSIGLAFHSNIFLTFTIFGLITLLLFVAPKMLWGIIVFGSFLLTSVFNFYPSILHINVTVIFIVIISLEFIGYKDLKLSDDPIGLFLFCFFCIYILISSFISSDIDFGFYKFKRFIMFAPFVYISFAIYKNNYKLLYKVFKIAFLIGLLYCIAAIAFPNTTYQGRLSMFDMNPIWFSRHLGLFVIIGLFLLKSSNILLVKGIYLINIVLMTIFMFLSGSRAPILSLVITFLAITLFEKRKIGQINLLSKLRIIIILIISIMIVALILNYLPENVSERILTKSSSSQESSIIRVLLIVDSFNLFRSSPIFGVGFGGFTQSVFGFFKYPHNIFLELACETGIIGILIFSLIIVRTFIVAKKLFKRFQLNSLEFRISMLLISAFCYTFLNAQFSGSIDGNLYLWFTIGGIFYFNTWNSAFNKVKQ